jgi:adenosylmethionine-8-amino-7-oxononanoate aminotransferase
MDKTETRLIKPMIDGHYPTVTYGDGIYLYDEKGKQYIDGSSGAVTASLGHAVPEILAAMDEQAHKVSFVYRSQFTSTPAEQLAQKLNELVSDDEEFWSFFVNSGSEATETALKIAIQYWQEQGQYQKTKIVSRWMSYHGITIGALSMSGHPARRERFTTLLEDYPSVSAPYCYRCPFNSSYPNCQLICANELERAIQRIGAKHIAAFIAEPIVGAAGGVIVPPKGYYEKIKQICEKYDILFISDEVMTGIGRTGEMFAMHHWGVNPDIIALGKGMSAGYTPMAATLVSEHVMEPIRKGSKSIMSGHTYSANPLSAAVSLAVLDYIEKNKLVEHASENGQYLISQLQALKDHHPMIGGVRGKGMLVGIEFVEDRVMKIPFGKEIDITNRVVKMAQKNGLLIYPSNAGIEGEKGDAVIIAPPLTITRQQIDELVKIMKQTISQLEMELQSSISNEKFV